MAFNLGEILRRSLEITVRNRILWLYGFLLVLTGGECFRFAGNLNLSEEQGVELGGFLQGLDPSLLITLIIVTAVVFLLFWLASVVISNWALGSLLEGIRQVAIDGTTSFSRSAPRGWRYFWSLLVIGILSGLLLVVLLLPVVAAGILAALSEQPAFLLPLCLWLPVALVAVLVLMLVVVITQVQLVLQDARPLEALSYSWKFLKQHLRELLLVWLVNDIALGCATGCALSALAGFAAIPVILGFLINPTVGAILLLPATVVLLLALLLNGIVQVFRKAVWLLTCQELGQEAAEL